MGTEKHKIKIYLMLMMAAIWAMLMVPVAPSVAQGEPTLTPPPNRPPLPSPYPGDTEGDDQGPAGAYIELLIQPAHPGLWSVVQWQDNTGNWHDVEGWRGTVDQRGYRNWWVEAKDFGKGPFRWIVTRRPGAPPMAISEQFYLPTVARNNVLVVISMQ